MRTAGLLLLASCGGTSALPFYRSASLVPEWLSASEAAAPSMHRVGVFALTDQHGEELNSAALRDKITVVQFFFTRCRDVCPITTAQLGRMLQQFPGESALQVLSLSVAPEADSVTALADFARTRRIADPRWHWLTGPRATLERLASESFFVGLGNAATYGVKSLAHTETLVLVDRLGRLRGLYAGTLPLEADRLAQDIRTLLAE